MKPYYEKDGISIYHGDCREILPSLGSFDVLITDPPYGVNLGAHAGGKETRVGLLVKSGGYEDSPENFCEVVVPAISRSLEVCERGMVFCVPPSMWQLPAPDAIGGVFVSGAVGRNRWGWSSLIHCLLYGVAPNLKNGAKATAIASNAMAEKTGHPVTKPLSWLRWAVSLGSAEGDTILEPFAGSGTTLLAAKQLGRRAVGIELSERYCEIAAKRLDQKVFQFPKDETPKESQAELFAETTP